MYMKWRKWNNILHRDLGYLFFGLTIIYVISGISLNHKHNWNPNYIQALILLQRLPPFPKSVSGVSPMNWESHQRLRAVFSRNPADFKYFLKMGTLLLISAAAKQNWSILRRDASSRNSTIFISTVPEVSGLMFLIFTPSF